MSEALTPEARKLLPELKKLPRGFYMAGGTALALQISHRLSVDFDFFSPEDISASLLGELESRFSELEILVNNPEELTAIIGKVKVTFLKYPFPVLNGFVEYEGVKLLTIPEIGAAKAYSIGRRATYKDYVDLYFILKESCSLREIVDLAQKKYQGHFDPRLFLEQMIYLEDVEDLEIEFLKKPVSKDELQNFFVKLVKSIEL